MIGPGYKLTHYTDHAYASGKPAERFRVHRGALCVLSGVYRDGRFVEFRQLAGGVPSRDAVLASLKESMGGEVSVDPGSEIPGTVETFIVPPSFEPLEPLPEQPTKRRPLRERWFGKHHEEPEE